MAYVEDYQPEIKFRWCRTVRCRTQVVYLVLTSVTGTQVRLNWQADLGWYESDPTPVPCGFHTGFILIKERIRDFVKDTLETRERDYKVDPFHIVPHKFAVELFLDSDEAISFWSEVPELRLRYLSSDHLEKLGASTAEDSCTEDSHKRVFPSRKWVSSTSLNRAVPSFLNLSKIYQEPKDTSIHHLGSLGRGKSHSQLAASPISYGGLYNQGKASTSSPNLSRAFQVAVDLSRASSKFLAGVSSTSSGVFLGYEDGSDPPSPENGNYIHTDSAYAAGGETSQESESGEGAKKRKKSACFSRGRSLQIDDLVGNESWRPKRERARGRLNLTDAPSSSFEDLLTSISASKRATVKTELNLMKFETLKRERLVQEILEPSDSDFEDEEAPCEESNPDLQGPFQCVITFESRSTSMDDVGSPRALEEALVSLTSNESHPTETSQPQPLPRTVLQPDLLTDESAFTTSDLESEEKRPTPKPRTRTPVPLVDVTLESEDIHTEEEKVTSGDFIAAVPEPLISITTSDDDAASSKDQYTFKDLEVPHDFLFESTILEDVSGHHEGKEFGYEDLLAVSDPRIRTSDSEDDNFQYDSLKHDDNENLPIDIRNIDSEESLDVHIPKVKDEVVLAREDPKVEDEIDSRPEEGEDESEEAGVYEVEGAEAAFSSIDGEVPTDTVALVPLDSYKGTVREVKVYGESLNKIKESEDDEESNGKYIDEGLDVELLDVSDKDRTPERDSEFDVSDKDRTMERDSEYMERDSEYIDNEESDRSETEAIFNVTDVSRKHSVDSKTHQVVSVDEEDSRSDLDQSNETRTRAVGNGHREFRRQLSGDKSSIYTGDNGYREHKSVINRDNKDLRRQFSDGDVIRRRLQTIGTNGFAREENSENRRPYIRPLKLLNTATQTAAVKKISRTTSIDAQKFSESDTNSSNDRHPTKYGRSPLRNRTNGQAESYTPLPDRLSGPWSHKFTASASNARSSATFVKPDLIMLQRNLYNLAQGDEAMQILQNSVHLQKVRNHQHSHHLPLYQSKPHIHHHHHHSTDRTSTSETPLQRHVSPEHHYYRHQSAEHKHYQQHHYHHSPVHHQPQPKYYTTPYQYKYPLLSTSVITPKSPSRSPMVSSIRSSPISGKYSGSVSDLRRTSQRTKQEYVTSPSRSRVNGVRPATSLPDLRPSTTPSSSLPRQPSPASSTSFAHTQQGPKHAQSALDIMVGGYSSRGKRVSWREWRMDEDSDSGGSTDSLIDEAEHVATSSINLTNPDWDGRYRKRHRSRRRRTRSHQGFSSSRDDSEGGRGSGSDRPYLPYRGDQLSPGQQVKVLAPGGGVAVARVVTNQRSAFIASRTPHYSTSGIISPASVTVILLSEPNRLQGSVVTVPLEKVLLAWPRA